MKTIIVDDELDTIGPVLKRYLQKYAADIELCGQADNLEHAYQLIISQKPDLVFLDAEIGGQTSFELLQKFLEPDFMVIFVTAHANYAMKAIKFGAIDYLSKPVAEDDFNEAIKRAKQRKLEKRQIELLNTIHKSLLKKELPDRIAIHETSRDIYIEIYKIKYLKASESSTEFFLKEEKKKLVSSQHLGFYENKLTEYDFFLRVHRSFIVNLKEVAKYDKSSSYLHLTDGDQIPLGGRFKDQALKFIDKKMLS